MHPMCSVDSCATLSGAGLDRNRSSICASLGPWLMRENMENPVPCSRTQASYLLGTRHGWTMWAAWKDFTSNLSNILYNIFLLYLYNTYIYIYNKYIILYEIQILYYNIQYYLYLPLVQSFPVFPHVSRGPHFLRSQDTRRLQREGGSSPLRDVPRPL